MKTTYLDTETLGLYGPMAILQYQQDGGEPVLYSPWEMPAGVTRSLIESIVKSRVVCHNITFDWQKIQQFYNGLRAFADDQRPIDDIKLMERSIFENRSAYCLKPRAAVCTLMLAQKELGGTSLASKEIRVRKVPHGVAESCCEILNSYTKLPDILFAKRRHGMRWEPAQSDGGEGWLDLVLRFGPSNALKDIAKFVLEVDDTQKIGQDFALPNFPVEEGFAPYSNLLDDGTGHYDGKPLWPLLLEDHINFWQEPNSPQLKYALDDIILLKRLDEHFGCPATDFDSEIGCQVASVRAAGFSIDNSKLDVEVDSSEAIVAEAAVNVDSPNQVKQYIASALDPMEAHIVADSCDKDTLKKITTTFVLDEAEECCDEAGCQRCGGQGTLPAGAMPVVGRAQHILDIRKHRKRLQLYKKLQVAKGAFPSFRVIGTKSGRMSGADGLNYHGIDGSREIREIFTLSDSVLSEVSGGDFDSQELAIAAAVMNDDALADDIAKGKSLHGVFAASASGLPYEQIMANKEDKATPEANWYKKAKICVYAILYGASSYNISFTLGVSPEEAEKTIQDFFAKYPQMAETRKSVKRKLECLSSDADGNLRILQPEQTYIESIFGFRRSFDAEFAVIEAMFQAMNEVQAKSKEWGGEIIRKEEKGKQTYGGATVSAFYGGIFSLQGKILRAALNHLIQSAGRTVTLTVQKAIWDDLQSAGIHPFIVKLASVHDEIFTVQRPTHTPWVTNAVRESVAELCKTVPLLSLEWASDVGSWYGVKSESGERCGWEGAE